MYHGKLVEFGSIEKIFSSPEHPHTKGLLNCRPRMGTLSKRLPTVSDYMEKTTHENGEYTLKEKTMNEAEFDKLMNDGRGPYSPKSVLEKMQHKFDSNLYANDTKYSSETSTPILQVKNLCVYFPIRKGILRRVHDYVKAVDDISFDIYRGQTLGLVGESGCGKTTAGRAIVRLIEPTKGQIIFDNKDMNTLDTNELRVARKRFQVIFQDPYGSLNPRWTIESILTEGMMIHGLGENAKERRDKAIELLAEVGLPGSHLLNRYPHEFSGGQRQRICIARALTVEPELIICDESVSALDVSVQAQVLNLLKELQLKRQLTYLFISHDLSVVKFMSDMIAVMNAGKIIEFGASESIYANPQAAYTEKLIEAIPKDTIEQINMRQNERKKPLQNVYLIMYLLNYKTIF